MKEKLSKTAATGVLGRVVRYVLHYYKGLFALVLVCIVVSAVSTVIGSAFPQTLVDDYLVPTINSGSQDFSGLFHAIVRLVGILAVGVVAIFAYNRIMVNISQGTMRHLRDDLFHKMESLPIKYFDTHAHGDIMSVYTNDVDTLRPVSYTHLDVYKRQYQWKPGLLPPTGIKTHQCHWLGGPVL